MEVDISGDVQAAIEEHAHDCSMVFVGATDKGLLSRLVEDTLHLDVIEEVEPSVVLAERPQEGSLWEKLFGRGTRQKIQEEIEEKYGGGSEPDF